MGRNAFIIKRGIDRWYAFGFCNVSGCEKTYEWQKNYGDSLRSSGCFLYRNPVVLTGFWKPVVPVRCGDRKQSGIGICGCSYRGFFVSCKCQICESGVSGENQRYYVCGKHCSDAGTFVHHQWTGQFCDNSAVFYFCRCLCTAGVYLDFEE